MIGQLLTHETANAIQRERRMAGAPRTGIGMRTDWRENDGLTASARYEIGSALVRLGRALNGSAAPRPEPVGR